jgi:hypothetical protein
MDDINDKLDKKNFLNNKFWYGIDEYFFNNILTNYFISNNIKFSYQLEFTIASTLFSIKKYINPKDTSYLEKFNYFLGSILGYSHHKLSDEKLKTNIDINLKRIYELLWTLDGNIKFTDEARYVAHLFFNQLEQFIQRNDYSIFNKDCLINLYSLKDCIFIKKYVVFNNGTFSDIVLKRVRL